jgi:hypothetical protein
MPSPATVFRVVIASPSDIREERRMVRQVVHDWNAAHATTRGIVLLPVGWESDSAPLMGDRPQSILNSQIIRNADLLIAVFWTRLGTPTGNAPSGTIEEIQELLSAKKPVMIYFSSAPVRPESVDQPQYAALLVFRQWCETHGLVGKYDSAIEFQQKLTRELAVLVNTHPLFGQKFPMGDTLEAHATTEPDPAVTLSEEAKVLLDQATRDPNGTVIVVDTLGGLTVQTNGRNFAQEADARAMAAWRAAVAELLEHDFLRALGPKNEVFQVTRSGYEAVDRVRS